MAHLHLGALNLAGIWLTVELHSFLKADTYISTFR